MIARGTHRLVLAHDGAKAARSRQLHAHRMAWPLLLAFTKDPGPDVVAQTEVQSSGEVLLLADKCFLLGYTQFFDVHCQVDGSVHPASLSPSPLRGLYSALRKGRGLPADAHLLSLHDDGEGIVILRLVNTCQVRASCCACARRLHTPLSERLLLTQCHGMSGAVGRPMQ